MMKLRKHAGFAALFLCSYLGFLGYWYVRNSAAHHDGSVAKQLLRNLSGKMRQLNTLSGTEIQSAPQTERAVAVAQNVATQVADSLPVVTEAQLHDQELQTHQQRTAEFSVRAVTESDATQRAAAIDQLGDLATPEALNALEAAIVRDDSPRNRMRALNSLARLATDTTAQPTVLAILRRAMASERPEISAKAAALQQQILNPQQFSEADTLPPE